MLFSNWMYFCNCVYRLHESCHATPSLHWQVHSLAGIANNERSEHSRPLTHIARKATQAEKHVHSLLGHLTVHMELSSTMSKVVCLCESLSFRCYEILSLPLCGVILSQAVTQNESKLPKQQQFLPAGLPIPLCLCWHTNK